MNATVSEKKKNALADKMKSLNIKESDLVEKFIKGSGSGGQKINKTSSCVYLKHISTGIEIKCQSGRSQSLNRYHARYELCERILERTQNILSAKRKEQERIRLQKRRRSRRQKQKILETKHHRSSIKESRRRVDTTE